MWNEIPYLLNFILYQMVNIIDVMTILHGLPVKDHKKHVFLKMFLGIAILSCMKYFGNFVDGVVSMVFSAVCILYLFAAIKVFCIATFAQSCFMMMIIAFLTSISSFAGPLIYSNMVSSINMQIYNYHSWDMFYIMLISFIALLFMFFIYIGLAERNTFQKYQISIWFPAFSLFVLTMYTVTGVQSLVRTESQVRILWVLVALAGTIASGVLDIVVINRYNQTIQTDAEIIQLDAERKQLQSDYELMEERIEQRARIRHDYNNQIQVAKGILELDRDTGMKLLDDMKRRMERVD